MDPRNDTCADNNTCYGEMEMGFIILLMFKKYFKSICAYNICFRKCGFQKEFSVIDWGKKPLNGKAFSLQSSFYSRNTSQTDVLQLSALPGYASVNSVLGAFFPPSPPRRSVEGHRWASEEAPQAQGHRFILGKDVFTFYCFSIQSFLFHKFLF